MTCSPGHRGPPNIHVHIPTVINDHHGSPIGRLCPCGEVFDIDGRPLDSIADRTKVKETLEKGVRDALRAEMEAQGLDPPDELKGAEGDQS